MTARQLLATVSVFLFSAVISAQSYSVRVTYNTNLRAGSSLDATILDTAKAGTMLSVAGNHANWLRVDWKGRNVWMADWVPMTRMGGQGAPAGVDNCCFVDRQCATDSEWIAGYWAFQNNQCGAPVQSVTESPAQTDTSSPANVDNCCFIDRHCTTELDWTQGYWAYQNNQCSASAGSAHGVIVEGTEGFHQMVQRAFQLLQRWAPDWYSYVTRALYKIRQEPASSSSGIYIDSRTYGVDTDIQAAAEVTSHDVVDMVGGLAHEACHVHQWWDGTATEGWRNEIGCLRAQLAATEAVDPLDRFSPWLLHLIANIQNPAYWWWTH